MGKIASIPQNKIKNNLLGLDKVLAFDSKLFKSSYTVYLLLPFDLVISFLTTYYLIRYLPIADMGAYNLIGSMLVFYSFLTSFGFVWIL